ncbi:hypothetical protein V8C34DRAFT_77091 [Trichoderma compactum]
MARLGTWVLFVRGRPPARVNPGPFVSQHGFPASRAVLICSCRCNQLPTGNVGRSGRRKGRFSRRPIPCLCGGDPCLALRPCSIEVARTINQSTARKSSTAILRTVWARAPPRSFRIGQRGWWQKKRMLRKGGRANGSFVDPQLDHREHHHRIYSVNVGDKDDKYRKASLRRAGPATRRHIAGEKTYRLVTTITQEYPSEIYALAAANAQQDPTDGALCRYMCIVGDLGCRAHRDW